MDTELKDRIRDRLHHLGKSARAASVEAGLHPDTIRNVLRERSKKPRGDSLVKLARALNVTVEWLMEGHAPQIQTGSLPPLPHIASEDSLRHIPVLNAMPCPEALSTGAFCLETTVIDHVPCPQALEGARDIYALYIQDNSMAPRHTEGELLCVSERRPPRAGDDVIVQTTDGTSGKTRAYCKHLISRSSENLVLGDYTSRALLTLPLSEVKSVHRILSINELFGVLTPMPARTSYPARSVIRRAILGSALVVLGGGIVSPARAAFETWVYPAEPLPYACTDVAFERSDRRAPVSEAIRALVQKHIDDSGLCQKARPTPPLPTAHFSLLHIRTHAAVGSDGTGWGDADILYRVQTPKNAILFNDRIHSRGQVSLQDGLTLRQATNRAARNRAFAANLNQLLLHVGMAAQGRQAYPLPDVSMAYALETPERTQDFTARAAEALLLNGPEIKDRSAHYRISGLGIRQLPATEADKTTASVILTLQLLDTSDTVLWQGTPHAEASISRAAARDRGILPLDAAIATALQTALRTAAPEIALQYAQAQHIHDLRDGLNLPYTLGNIATAPGAGIDPTLIATVRNWSAKDGIFADIWQGGPKRVVRLQALHSRLHPTATGGRATVSGTYAVEDTAGKILMIIRRDSTTSFTKAATSKATRPVAEGALQNALMDNWASVLRTLQEAAP